MMPAVFINCSRFPFITWILLRKKVFETRTRNMLGRFLGQRILLVETGRRSGPVVRGSAVVAEIIEVYTRDAWEKYRTSACILADSEYDWQPGTKKKVLYRLEDVKPCILFPLPDCVRHGRTWAEYTGSVINL